MTLVIAAIGAKALYLTFLWLGSAILASLLSDRKGYGEKAGLATGIVLSVVGVIVWLVVPPKANSRWKLRGAFGRKGGGKTVAEARAEGTAEKPA
jgi:hypothetical protein